MTDLPQLLLDNQLCFPLYAAARMITGSYTPLLKPFGLTYTQYVTLLALWEQDDVTVGDLSRRLYLDSGTLTPLLKRMAADGLLTRERDAVDERVVRIRLTEKGSALRHQVADVPAQVGGCVRLNPAEAQTLYQLLYKVIAGYQEVEP